MRPKHLPNATQKAAASDSARTAMSAPWELTVWVVTQEGRPFDYRFSRAAAFQRAKELREGAPSGDWSVEERRAHLVVLEQDGIEDAEEQDNEDKEDLIAGRLADSLIDYIRAPYSRSWLVERINAAIKRDTGEALRPLGASGSEVPWSLTSAPPPPASVSPKQDADVARAEQDKPSAVCTPPSVRSQALEEVARRHVLKTWPMYFQPMVEGHKTFELRKNDRDFRVGDVLELREYDLANDHYSGRFIEVVVTYVLERGELGLAVGFCVLGIRALIPLPAPDAGWRDMESAPKDGTSILWCTDRGEYMRRRYLYEVIRWPTHKECFEEGHWLPLPVPPVGDQT